MQPEPLVMTERGNFPEKLHYGFIQLINENSEIILKIGEGEKTPFPFRSGAKPLQATAVIDSRAYEYFNFTDKELAIICASHAGTSVHIEKVAGILKKIGLAGENLQCGAHMPLDASEKENFIKHDAQPNAFHNNCSGKHAGMLAVCVKNNWDVSDYLNISHPLQEMIMQNIKDLCKLEKLPETALDGCSAPVPVMPHHNMGVGFLNLLLNPKYSPLKNAIAQNPYIIGGNNRLDSEIIAASGGKLIAKVAAEGVCIVANLELRQVLVVKIIDADSKARSIVTIDSLIKLGWLGKKQVQLSEKLDNLYKKQITNWKKQVVGEIKTLFMNY